jgi:hypothetical protein
MLRSFRYGLVGLFPIAAVAGLPLACQSGGVGDPCTPEYESDPQFSGFALTEGYIESRSFQCGTRICLVNHFQGRVSCPLGQAAEAITDCGGPSGANDDLCDKAHGETCALAADYSLGCDPSDKDACAGPPRRFVCHKPNNCQQPSATPADNAGKDCCVPGTDTPVGVPVCAQCDQHSNRDAAQAVYCSCRCGIADGAPEEPDFNFCTCPTGFTCSEIRPYLGPRFGDPLLTGKYCIKEGTAYDGSPNACGAVAGNHEAPCLGIGDVSPSAGMNAGPM